MHPIEYAKKHPFLIGGGVIAAVVLVLVLNGGGGGQPDQSLVGGSIPMGQGGASDGADQIQAMQANINGQIQLANIAAASHTEELGAANFQADLAAQTADNANTIAGNLGMAQITAQLQAIGLTANRDVSLATIQAESAAHGIDVTADVTKYIQSLAAQTSQQANTLSAQVAQNAQNNATQQLTIATNGSIAQTKLVADTLVKQAQISGSVAQAQVAKKCTSVLFGLFSSC